jgi:hypothetical protein
MARHDCLTRSCPLRLHTPYAPWLAFARNVTAVPSLAGPRRTLR